jgi:hypothetical protein
MHIMKYGPGFTRRHFLQTMGAGFSAGVLRPLWDVIAETGRIERAYPDELLDIGMYTKGKINVGDKLTADNVDLVKDLMDEVTYIQIKQQGRVCDIAPTEKDVYRLNPPEYLDASMRNQGMAKFDEKGNVVTQDGKPWIGGIPWVNPTEAGQVIAAHNLSWGRYDVAQYCIDEYDMDADGNEQYHYNFWWCEVAGTCRISMDPKPYMPTPLDKNGEGVLRYQSAVWDYPNDVKGTSILNIWPYDATKYPDFFGYLPAFKRVRRFPTNQRFEPVIAGSTFYLTDAWMTGDPTLTWGNFKLVGRGPALLATNGDPARDDVGWNAVNENWRIERHGGKSGKKFWNSSFSLVPEVFVVELEPTGYPRAPYSKKRIWYDARTIAPITMNSFDRRGQVWKQWEAGFDNFSKNSGKVHNSQKGASGGMWSWLYVHSHDIQSGRITSFQHSEHTAGGMTDKRNFGADGLEAYTQYTTEAAIRRLGT